MKLPHARPDPRYYPPESPPGMAFDLIVAALMVGTLLVALAIAMLVR